MTNSVEKYRETNYKDRLMLKSQHTDFLTSKAKQVKDYKRREKHSRKKKKKRTVMHKGYSIYHLIHHFCKPSFIQLQASANPIGTRAVNTNCSGKIGRAHV